MKTWYILFDDFNIDQIELFDSRSNALEKIYLTLLSNIVNHDCRIEDIRTPQEIKISLVQPPPHQFYKTTYKILKMRLPENVTIMKVKDILSEMSPKSIGPVDWNFSDIIANKQKAKELLRDNRKKELFKDGSYVLFEFPVEYALIDTDESNPHILYYVQYKVDKIQTLDRICATQIKVWRDTTNLKSEGVAKKIFFDYLLPRYKTIITDSAQTKDGQRFLDIRITEALARSDYVYFIDLMSSQQKKIEIRNSAEYVAVIKNQEIWGPKHQKYKTRRIIITTEALKTTE